ncbi:hypothetical protein [Candidatus Clostridium helianthi]|uniref:Uncharacterized protein n=1 Tax=Candidatus Clostridium helianthi TaxID=3381660 RepID=A0ABW8S5W5_9CLOT
MVFITGMRTGKTALLNKVEEMKIDFSRVNGIFIRSIIFLKEFGFQPNEIIVNYDFYCSMLNDPEIANNIIVKDDLTKYYKGMKIIIDNSIKEFDLRHNKEI